MKKAILAILLLGANLTYAATIESSWNGVRSIRNLEIAGSYYNVNFIYESFESLNDGNSFPFFSQNDNGALATASVIEINEILESAPSPHISLDNGSQQTYYLVPYQYADDGRVLVKRGQKLDISSPDWTQEPDLFRNPSLEYVYAQVTLVPLPPAAYFFLSALLGLGAYRQFPTIHEETDNNRG